MKKLIVLILMNLLCAGTALAGDMVGTVKHGFSTVMVNAKVDILLNGRVVRTVYTDSWGKFRAYNLPHSTSTYTVTATKGSFKGTNPNCALFLPGRFYWYPATCNVSIR